ncbi:MAG: nucleotidyltransferase substrate binding protein [Elusimicrobia bacterium]|nr:nucleotidyltransferase substrate binding protein [Elusimicrobiota bacterium]
MKEEIKFSLKKLKDAFSRLEESAEIASSELEKDGVIQRFEFTFELLWKALKIFLEKEGIICKTPRECLKQAFKINWINDEKTFLNMLEDRNETSHIYDKATAEKIFGRIKGKYVGAIEKVVEKLEESQE